MAEELCSEYGINGVGDDVNEEGVKQWAQGGVDGADEPVKGNESRENPHDFQYSNRSDD